MAGNNSVIGALRVDLGLNSAQFSAGLKNAQKGLGDFGKLATRSFAAMAAAATVAAGALGVAVKGAIDHADALAKSAQKAGTTVEALSRLEYAAKLSDVSLESLTGGLQKLGKSMSDAIITPTSTAATAFKALGIEIKNSDGTMRNSDAVLADVADRFSRLEDGSTKTALAMQMFGKSGAELIPLLNSGRDGLKSMADESDRLGITISTKTAKAAETFNDTLTTIGQILQGVVNKMMEAALPALQSLADKLASPEFADAAQKLAATVIPVIEGIANAAVAAANALDFLQNGSADFQFAKGRTAALKQLRAGLAADSLNMFGGGFGDRSSSASLYDGIIAPGGGLVKGTPAKALPAINPIFTDRGAASAASKAAAKQMSDQLKAMNADLELQKQRWEDLQQPIRDTVDAVAGSLSGALSGLVSDLIKGKDAVGGLINAFGQLGDRLIQMAMDQMIQGLIGSLFGAAFGGGAGLGVGKGLTGAATYGFTGNGVYGIPKFDGGGFTGAGPRAGGVDGKGGFLAMLHPNETVLDHSKGQGGMTMNFNITGSKQDAAAIANLIEKKARGVFLQMQKNDMRG